MATASCQTVQVSLDRKAKVARDAMRCDAMPAAGISIYHLHTHNHAHVHSVSLVALSIHVDTPTSLHQHPPTHPGLDMCSFSCSARSAGPGGIYVIHHCCRPSEELPSGVVEER